MVICGVSMVVYVVCRNGGVLVSADGVHGVCMVICHHGGEPTR